MGDGDFITGTDGAFGGTVTNDWLENNLEDSNNIDDDGSLRIAQWSKTDGTSICPIGFRVPTSTELYAETTQYSGTDDETTGAVDVTNRDTCFKNFLRFPALGSRIDLSGSLDVQGYYGVVWSSSVGGGGSRSLGFGDSYADEGWFYRATGFSVRCVKD